VAGVLKRWAKILMVMALASSIGLQWALLQAVAWTSMLTENLRTTSFAQAVHLTFDGKHPCSLCKAIATGERSEHKNESKAPSTKFEFPPAGELGQWATPGQFPVVTSGDLVAHVLPSRPPTPPPRSFFA
jgi:hypothetical protein